MSIKGLKVGELSLEKYNPMWKEEFLKEKENLEKIIIMTFIFSIKPFYFHILLRNDGNIKSIK